MSILRTTGSILQPLLTPAKKTVHWHPKGITSVRRFTIESCAALPTRILKGKPSSLVKNANPEAARPFQIPPENEHTNIQTPPAAEPSPLGDDYIHISLLSDPYFPEYLCPGYTQSLIDSQIDKILNGDFKSILDSDYDMALYD
jgi:hypothetical protein